MRKQLGAAAVLSSSLAVACGGEPSDAPAVGEAVQSIVGGYVDPETHGVVGLGVEFGGRYFAGHCSGTLIAPNLVLTARHCIALTNEGPEEGVICGETEFTAQGDARMFLASPSMERPIDPRDRTFYRGAALRVAPGADDMCGYDIALIILEGEGMPASVATPIVPRIDIRPMPREEFSASGFGLTSPDGTGDGVRMRSDGNTVRCAGIDCGLLASRTVKDTEWISTDARVCPGDSGGPALDADGRVIGVASRGTEDCSSVIYGDVAAWGSFIIDVALEAAEMGGYDAPFWTLGSSTPPVVAAEDAGTAPPAEPLLGQTCDGPCGGGYACFTESGEPPGICVPPCGPDATCPTGYVCGTEREVCVPEGGQSIGDDGGCAVKRSKRGDELSLSWIVLALTAAAFRRRRRGD